MNKNIELEKVLEYLSSRGILVESQFKYQILDNDTLLPPGKREKEMIDIEKIPDFLVSRGIIIDNLSLNELIK
jgi:hypothetical protein